jgi:hypothetical protein
LLLTSCFFLITCKMWINSRLATGGICQQLGKVGWTLSPARLKKWRNRWAFNWPNSTKTGWAWASSPTNQLP